jgi:hypothetical protein
VVFLWVTLLLIVNNCNAAPFQQQPPAAHGVLQVLDVVAAVFPTPTSSDRAALEDHLAEDIRAGDRLHSISLEIRFIETDAHLLIRTTAHICITDRLRVSQKYKTLISLR